MFNCVSIGYMPIVNVKQNSKEWREWRDKGLGASDAPIIMGVSPWTTRFQLWGHKTGLFSRPTPNAFQVTAMQRGHDLEPRARKLYEETYNVLAPAASFEHPEHPFLRASLDGFVALYAVNVEIKCPGKVDHATAVKGQVPKKYIPQIQMQMLVSGAKHTHYCSWDGEGALVILDIKPDLVYQSELLLNMIQFWDLVKKKQPPKFEEGEQQKILTNILKELTSLQNTVKLLSFINEDGFINVTKGDK